MTKSATQSPENVFDYWLTRISSYMKQSQWGMEDEDATARGLLACVLELGDAHGKVFEMYNWVQSQQGQRFFEQDKYQPAGVMISSQAETFKDEATRFGYLQKHINESTREEITTSLREFVEDNSIYINPKPTLD